MIIYCDNKCSVFLQSTRQSKPDFKKQQLESELHVMKIMKFETKIKTSVHVVDASCGINRAFCEELLVF